MTDGEGGMRMEIAVNTEYGRVSGRREGSCVVFKGIPYARPPVGSLRFRPAVPCKPWDGVYDASRFACRCYQDLLEGFINAEFYPPDAVPPMDEDCLYLNIWTPDVAPEKPMPVAFWLHGGAHMNGFGSEMEFDGQKYCERGVVLVTVNYRLGVFGFFAHKALKSLNGETGNMALTDQLLALDWVCRNISAFGGDPDNITAFGQSSGAKCVQTLLCSPAAKGKIKRAILQSGGGCGSTAIDERSLKAGMEMGDDFLRLSNCTIQDMLSAPAEQLNAWNRAYYRHQMGRGVLPYQPLSGTALLPYSYREAMDDGLYEPVSTIIGCVTADMEAANQPRPSLERSVYYRGITEWCVRMGKNTGKPSYAYCFAHKLPGSEPGMFHCCELWYVFGTLSRSRRPMTEADELLSCHMVSAWTQFMKHGDPNGDGYEEWTPCEDTKRNSYLFR